MGRATGRDNCLRSLKCPIQRRAPVCTLLKGRVERVNRTLQDRLVKELRLDDVCDLQAGNDFLPEFISRFNEKFSVRAAKPEDLHRRPALSPDRLSDILCHHEQRHVGQQLTLAYDCKQLVLERSAVSEELGASMWISMTSRTEDWKCAGRDRCFPTRLR